MTDDITPRDLEQFARDLGFRRITPALRKRLQDIVAAAVGLMGDLSGPERKRIRDVIAEQARWLAKATGLEMEIPEGDLIIINRP
jgi:serine/threonine-protein kinase HipA